MPTDNNHFLWIFEKHRNLIFCKLSNPVSIQLESPYFFNLNINLSKIIILNRTLYTDKEMYY